MWFEKIKELIGNNVWISILILLAALITGALVILTLLEAVKRKDRQIIESLHKDFAVDLKKYAGKWHEVARLPNRFEKDCINCVTAEYDASKESHVSVKNTCEREAPQTPSVGTGKAWSINSDNTWLKVSFIPYATLTWPTTLFAGDYLIHYVDPDYQTALVGSPDKKSFWLLSRNSDLDKTKQNELLEKAKKLGYDTEKLIFTGCK